MTVVLATSLICGRIARRVGQARVIGEIFGGILLGPSVLGRIASGLSGRVFPAGSLGSLDVLSTVGLILFLFLVGSELDLEHLRRQKSTATVSSFASILLPFGMALLAAPVVHARFASNNIGRLPFALFLGVSMSITAFPVLARILEERNLQKSPHGATALLCAAVDDVTAWMLLATALTFVSTNGGDTEYPARLLWLGAYLAVMLFLVRPLGRWLAARRSNAPLSYELLHDRSCFRVFGRHGRHRGSSALRRLFGRRVLSSRAGVAATDEEPPRRDPLADTAAAVFRPDRAENSTGSSERYANMAVDRADSVLATAGKMGGAILGARLTGQDWRFSFALGALLNTRGLVELIVLNIAYNAHVFSPTLFTMLVVMALVTTAITVPILDRLKIGIAHGNVHLEPHHPGAAATMGISESPD
jgi:Kef-type K+ transport system membrane component KefB